MLYCLLFASFADAACQARFEALQQALEAETTAEPTLLLGNFLLGDDIFDAVVIRPRSITTVVLAGPGQHEQPHNQVLASRLYEQFQRHQRVLADWVSETVGRFVSPRAVTGLVVFDEQVQLGTTLEAQLRQLPQADSFHLVGSVAHVPRRLWQLTRTDINLSEETVRTWAQELGGEAAADDDLPQEVSELVAPMGFWEHKARQLWRWLGAEDVPADLPYGPVAETAAASRDEKARLEQIRQQVRAELQTQNQEAQAREAAREHTIAELQAQLRQATAPAPEMAALQARLEAETREKEVLAETVRQAQAESAARNQELDARIAQLGTLLQELQQRPTPAPPRPAPTTSAQPAPTAPRRPTAPPPRPTPTWQLQWRRVAVVAAIAGVLGWVVWGALHFSQQFTAKPHSTRQAATRHRGPAAAPSAETETDEEPADSVAEVSASEQAGLNDSTAEPAATPATVADSSQVMPEVTAPELDDTAPPQP